MGVIGGALGHRLLKTITKNGTKPSPLAIGYAGKNKLQTLFGPGFWHEIENQVVVDFGCGVGSESIEMAQRGAGKVIGIDIQERFLSQARERARAAGVLERCTFCRTADEPADVIVATDSFEHFDDPAGILEDMRQILKPSGCVLTSFGPTWYHPYGGHLFSVFPWAHLIFTERALIRWRSEFKSDGATRFCEVAGGLNQMTIRRFERVVQASPFEFASFEAVPIRNLQFATNPLTREFTTSIVRCKLVPRKATIAHQSAVGGHRAA